MDPPGIPPTGPEQPRELARADEDEENNAPTNAPPPREDEEDDDDDDSADEEEETTDGEEDEDRFLFEEMLPPKDPRRMRLTAEERNWAVALKEAIEATPDLDNLSDFLYAQIAMVEQGNVEKALERAHTLQGFREEYHVLDTFEDATWRLGRWIQRLPGHIMHHFFSEYNGGYVAVIDAVRMDTSCVDSLEGIRDFLGGTYYVHHTLCVDLCSVRQGATMFLEYGGYRWKVPNYTTLKMLQLSSGESIASYPFEIQQIQCYNVGTVMNTAISLCRKLLPEQMRNKVSVGHHNDVGSLRDICLVPTVEAATERVTQQMNDALRQRYDNIDSFKL